MVSRTHFKRTTNFEIIQISVCFSQADLLKIKNIRKTRSFTVKNDFIIGIKVDLQIYFTKLMKNLLSDFKPN